MKRSAPDNRKQLRAALWLAASSLALICPLQNAHAQDGEESTPTPASNDILQQECTVYGEEVPPSSEATIQAVNEAARNGLSFFLDRIPAGREQDFSFTDREQIAAAKTDSLPFQVYIRCNGIDYPTGTWRVPVSSNGEPHGFLDVEWRYGQWQAVNFGAAQLANTAIKQASDIILKKTIQTDEIQHRRLIRDHRNLIDYLQLSSLPEENITAKTVLDYPEIIQEQNQWCWAGVSASLFAYFDNPVEQCEIAEYVRNVATWHDFGDTDCCVDPDGGCNYWNYNWGNPGSIDDILTNMQSRIEIDNYGVGSALTATTLESDLDNDLPPVIRWGWDSGGGHFLVAFGMEENGANPADPIVHYMDPWFGEGHHLALYSWVVRGGSHTWTHTNRLSGVTMQGDVDSSQHLTMADTVAALRILADLPTAAPQREADADGDGRIGMAEALYVMQRVAAQ